jgi:hypothetical protein
VLDIFSFKLCLRYYFSLIYLIILNHFNAMLGYNISAILYSLFSTMSVFISFFELQFGISP